MRRRPFTRQDQIDWVRRMRANLTTLHNQWYGHDGYQRVSGGMDKALFAETDHKIRTACSRLGIEVVTAFDEDGWDGEMYAPIVTLSNALTNIEADQDM